MRGLWSSAALALILLIAAGEARASGELPSPVRVVPLTAGLRDLAPDGGSVRVLLEGSRILGARANMSGLQPLTPLLELPALADLHGARLLPAGGVLAAYNTRGDGYIGNEMRAVVQSGSTRSEQRLNSPNTQASQLFDSIAVGPTGTLAVPFEENVLPYGTERFNSYTIAVRPPGATAFLEQQPLFPRGAQGYDVMDVRTFLGRDGGGWVFMLPSGDDWRDGQPVIILARRIEPDGRLGVLLKLPVPITRPVNTNVSVAAKFNKAGRLIAAFSESGYEGKDDVERSVVWTQTFAASTTEVPRRSTIVNRRGGYGYDDSIDIQVDAKGRAAVLALTRGGLRLFHRNGASWTPGPRITTTRHTWTARLVRLSDGRTAAVWLQPYNLGQDRSHLMVATGHSTDVRWPAHRVPGISRPGLVRLDTVIAFGDNDIAAAVYSRGESLVLTRIGR